MICQPGIDIVRYLLGPKHSRESISGDATAFVSAVSCLVHTASYVESLVRNSQHLGKINLIISAKCHPVHDSSSATDDVKLFRIWSPSLHLSNYNDIDRGHINVGTEQAFGIKRRKYLGHANILNSSPLQDQNNDRDKDLPLVGPQTDNPRNIALSTIKPSTLHKTMKAVLRDQTDDYQGKSVGNELVLEANGKIGKINPSIAVRCMSLLFDATGETMHANTLREWCTSDLSYEVIQAVVRDMFKLYRESICDELTSKKISLSGLSYKSLIPMNVRSELILLPITRYRMSSEDGYETIKWSEIRLNDFKKPDRNSKFLNFALICLNLQELGSDGQAHEVLRKYSLKGLDFTNSCEVFGLYTRRRKKKQGSLSCVSQDNSTVSDEQKRRKRSCVISGEQACRQRSKRLCSFKMSIAGTPRIVGHGSVMSQLTFLKGGRVPTSHMVAVFSDIVVVSQDLCTPEQLTTLSQRSSSIILWDKRAISRVRLIGPLGDCIGSAILVDDHPNFEDVRFGSFYKKSKTDYAQLDIKRAVIICDIVFEETILSSSVPYVCQQWYYINGLNRLIDLHFTDKQVPKTLSSLQKCAVEALWDKQFIQNELK